MVKKILKITAALAVIWTVIVPVFLFLRQRHTRKRIEESRGRDHAIAREKVYRGQDETVVIDDEDYADDPEE
ncbi:MAG: hypothetical protein IJH73_07255 [Lachnospiraceae bacterium]|nr:hypothetical protein [Lachnospiraceae bacterium]MBQ1514653.1 hypothetical protein [Lachnospiraceae bacterium]MBQ4308748.1 hypothetical protein [Lachnospiraceae bacterium]MBR0402290.1 hypothetical protein [Lachnospiraceae bacterium]